MGLFGGGGGEPSFADKNFVDTQAFLKMFWDPNGTAKTWPTQMANPCCHHMIPAVDV